jgi:hypothetical protein
MDSVRKVKYPNLCRKYYFIATDGKHKRNREDDMKWTPRIIICTALVAFSIISTSTEKANAGGLVECNNCRSPKDAALLSGSGLTLVADFEGAKLNAYEVEYDREIRKWRALSTPVPAQIQLAFYRIVDATTTQQMKALREKKQAGGGPVVILHPDNPGNSNGINFPDAYKGSNTFDIVESSTLRTRLGQHLATELSGASTGNTNWNYFANALQQAGLTWSSLKGGGTITIIINWRDGSRTVYKITAEDVTEAKYQKGESRDSTGNKVPDESIVDPVTAPSYAGGYYFGRSNDMERWARSAQQYGVPVTGASPGQSRMSCSWDGRTVTCKAL